jgi:hypothetical protein
MVSASEAFDLARAGNRDLAVHMIKQEFQKLQASDQKVELCKWIASCFENLQDYAQAAEWYEMAGVLSLSETGSPLINSLMALREYERALDCHERSGDEEGVQNCLEVIRDLNRSYVAA